MEPPPARPDWLCHGLTTKRQPCKKHHLQGSNYCSFHQGQGSEEKNESVPPPSTKPPPSKSPPPSKQQCSATCQTGKRCSKNSSGPDGLCTLHRNREMTAEERKKKQDEERVREEEERKERDRKFWDDLSRRFGSYYSSGPPPQVLSALKSFNLPETTDYDTVKKTYRKLALKHHPDKGGKEELFKQLNQQYEYLTSYYNTKK